MRSILLLGGTADARHFAKRFIQSTADNGLALRLIYSVAGLVRQPDVACEIISGGFTQYGGLAAYVKAQEISLILDMTHPFAKKMSETALDVATELAIPCWRFRRKAWIKQLGDQWTECGDWQTMVEASLPYKRCLITVGQLSEEEFQQLLSSRAASSAGLAKLNDAQAGQETGALIYRTAASPRVELNASVRWIKAIGPFSVEEETSLLIAENIDVLLTKNSGGESTEGKIIAARALGLPVLMMKQPEIKPAHQTFDCSKQLLDTLTAYMGVQSSCT